MARDAAGKTTFAARRVSPVRGAWHAEDHKCEAAPSLRKAPPKQCARGMLSSRRAIADAFGEMHVDEEAHLGLDDDDEELDDEELLLMT